MDRPPLQQQAATVRPAEDLDEPVVYRDGAEKCQQEVADARRRWLLRRLRNEYRFDNIEDGREVGGCITERFQQRRGVEFDASDRRQFDPRASVRRQQNHRHGLRAHDVLGPQHRHKMASVGIIALRRSPGRRLPVAVQGAPAEAHASRFRRRRSKPAEQQHRALIEDDGQRQRLARERGRHPPAPPSVP